MGLGLGLRPALDGGEGGGEDLCVVDVGERISLVFVFVFLFCDRRSLAQGEGGGRGNGAGKDGGGWVLLFFLRWRAGW